MEFRPCIDLKDGRVVQIVGGSLSDSDSSAVQTNFSTDRSPAEFAELYRQDGLTGGHVIALGPGNQDAALSAFSAYPGGLQMGGGVNLDNAASYLDAGASHVIVTSFVFRDGQIDQARLDALLARIGKARLVLDLSCRQRDGQYWIVTDRWQTFTDVCVTPETLEQLGSQCDEFLVHGVDVEGHQAGIEEALVEMLGEHSPIPATYAGGARGFDDLIRVNELGRGRVNLTIGSALDIFGGALPYRDVVIWHHQQ
ncbi:MAG: phosphoribosylformimino-5-aminoimidazole carboxamide ribotide isomerase [Rhodothermales bacterium]|jgi:phosphoribosylformimino-5-aminoimidazole carboxamide ribotide isomerase